jgi:hypothetical protein
MADEIIVNDQGFGNFEKRYPRLPGETDGLYAQRQEKAGTCLAIASVECRNIPMYKELLGRARHHHVPVLVITDPIPDLIADRAAESAAKSKEDHLAEARRADYLRNRRR